MITFLPSGIPLILGFNKLKRLTPEVKLIFWMSALTFVLSAWSTGLWLFEMNNLFIGHFYVVLQTLLIMKIYQLLNQGSAIEKGITIGMYVFFLAGIFLTVFVEPLIGFNPIGRMIAALILVSLSLLYFFKLLSGPTDIRLEKTPMFWFNSGVLLYFFCTLFIFVFSIYVPTNKALNIPVWVLHSILFWIFFILCSIAVWVSLRRTQ